MSSIYLSVKVHFGSFGNEIFFESSWTVCIGKIVNDVRRPIYKLLHRNRDARGKLAKL